MQRLSALKRVKAHNVLNRAEGNWLGGCKSLPQSLQMLTKRIQRNVLQRDISVSLRRGTGDNIVWHVHIDLHYSLTC